MPRDKIELTAPGHIQSHAYLFKQPGQGNYANKCIISSHGTYKANSPTFTPAVALKFFVPHGATLDDVPNLREVISGLLAPDGKLSVGPNTGPVTDYTLTKLQEHSADIAALAKRKGWTYADAEKELGFGGETYGALADIDSTAYDIATVRNRSSGGPIRLSEIIAAIETKHAYAEYYCVFCRELKP